MTLKGVCVGAGYFSQFHFDAWQRIPEVRVTAVCDTDLGKAELACHRFGHSQAYSNYQEMFDLEQPDFVDVITPPASHAAICAEAGKRGIAIICQKALAPDFEQSTRIVETAKSHNVRLMVHENFRFQPWHREIRRLIDAGAVGDRLHQIYFRSRMGDGWGADAYLGRQPYFREMPKLLVFETGVHFIDTFRFLAGEIDETYAMLKRLNPVIAGEDSALLTFRFASGATGVWDANRYNESNCDDPRYTFGEFVVEGSGGSIRLYSDGRLTLQALGQKELDHVYHHERRGFGGDCVYFTQKHFIDGLLHDQPFETSGDAYLKTLRVQEAAYESASLNRPVSCRLSLRESSVLPDFRGAKGENPDFRGANGDNSESVDANQSNGRVIDLSLPIDNSMAGVQITPFSTIDSKGWNTTTLSLYSHCGTHMDAPKHFLPDGDAASIDRQSLAVCCGAAKVIDLTPVQLRECITIERLADALARQHMTVEPGDRLLLRTDWSLRFGCEDYRNALPRISLELAHWLVARKVALIGVEPLSVADVNNKQEVTDVHHVLFRGGVAIVEGLTNLSQLSQSIVEFIALPLRIVGGDGSPVRAIAIEAAE
jgi:D-apiose dehydrogenase